MLFNSAKVLFAKGDLDWENDDIRVLLVTSSYTPDLDAHDFVNDITNELSGTGYARKTLSGKAVTQDNSNNRAALAADNAVYTALDAAAGTPAKAIVYKFITNDAASPLIGYVTLTSPPTPNGGDYTVKWNGGSSAGTLFYHGE